MASPKTVQIQYIVLFSHLTVRLPSVELSQKHDAAVCSPAPRDPVNGSQFVHPKFIEVNPGCTLSQMDTIHGPVNTY